MQGLEYELKAILVIWETPLKLSDSELRMTGHVHILAEKWGVRGYIPKFSSLFVSHKKACPLPSEDSEFSRR